MTAVFPNLSGLTYPVKKTPSFQTIPHDAVSGVSTTQSPQPYAKYAYDLPFEYLRSDNVNHELQTLMSFYTACKGMGVPFYFSDPDDNSVTGQLLGVGDGVTKAFPFLRTMGSVIEPVQSAIAAGLNVYDNSVLKTLTTDYTILQTSQYGTNYGVEFVSAPADGHEITADFSYYWLCRFSEDTNEFSKIMSKIWESRSVKFKTALQ